MKRVKRQSQANEDATQVGDTTKAAGDTAKSGTDYVGGKKQTADNPLGLNE